MPGVTLRAAGRLPQSSLTGLSLALRLVVVRGWAAAASMSATGAGSYLPNSSWRTSSASAVGSHSRQCCLPSILATILRLQGQCMGMGRRRGLSPVCLLENSSCSTSKMIGGSSGGMHTGMRTDFRGRRRPRSRRTWRTATKWERSPGDQIRAFITMSSQRGTGNGETAPGVSPEASGTLSAAAAGAGAGLGACRGDGEADEKEGSGGFPVATSSVLTLRSMRTARDRGGVKNKRKKDKPIKDQRSSRAVSTTASAPSAGGDSRGSPRLLRLAKLLADRAVGTRSEVDALVRRGQVKVDGVVVKSPKKKFPLDCEIEVNGQLHGPVPLLVAFHKPKGIITTLSDDWDRDDLSDVLPKSLLLKHHPVGRLDADTSGLLLLSSDGALTHRLLNPRFEVEREYVASVEVPPAAEEPGDALIKALGEGVKTADGVYEADVPRIDGREIRVVVREGKNRMVRRMLANAGYPVVELRRERYGRILLGDLQEGEHEPVSGEALDWAQSVLQLQESTETAPQA